MQNLLNKTLGKYEIVAELGKGTMGTVYLAHDPFTENDVAIKVAHPESLDDKESGRRYRKMFFHEAKVAGMLKHPNIVSVYDAGVEEDICYIVMEFVSGGRTLQDFCKPGKLLPVEDVIWIVFKCAKALDYAHRKGVVHRDVKPRNVLLTEDMEVKIGDFSIALATRADATETQVFGYVGSPLYMSPEQVMEGEITNRSDIFAIGVVMYELLTGKHPFAGDNLPAIIHQITRKPHVPVAELRSDVPAVLGHILDRTLKKEAGSRYKNGLDLAADLSLVFDSIKLSDQDLSDKEKFKQVRDLGFFHDFSEPEIWEVINACIWQEFEPGTEIIQEGDMDNAFYIIVSGDAVVKKRGRKVDVLHRGDCFGEMGFIAKRKRSASILADSTIAVMKVRASLIERASLSCQLRFHKVFLNTLITRLSLATDLITRKQQ